MKTPCAHSSDSSHMFNTVLKLIAIVVDRVNEDNKPRKFHSRLNIHEYHVDHKKKNKKLTTRRKENLIVFYQLLSFFVVVS